MTGELAAVISRLAVCTAVLRSRSSEAARAETNGGDAAELRGRIAEVVDRLERVADELENVIA